MSRRRVCVVSALALACLGMLWGGQGWATTLTNTSLETPPGVYFGTGNTNTHYTVDDEGGIELGLKAFLAFGPDIIVPAGAGGTVYTVPAGPQLTGPGAGTKAAWDVAYSIDLSGTTLNLSNINANVSIQDLTAGTPAFNIPIAGIGDNAFFPDGSNSSNATGEQNAESPSGVPGFDDNALHNYKVTLTVTNFTGQTVLASDTIEVDVVPPATPLPRTAGMGVLALAAMAGLTLYRRQTRVA